MLILKRILFVTIVSAITSFAQLDTGDVWTKLASGTTTAFSGISCPTVNTCYAVGDGGMIRKSNDTGSTWTAQTSGVTVNLYSVHFPSPDTGYVSGQATILKTTNGGTTWTVSRNTGAAYTGLRCLNTSRCLASASSAQTVLTTDGGATWTTNSLGTSSLALVYEIRFTTSNTVWVGGGTGSGAVLIRNTTGGTGSWSANLAPAGAGDIYAMFWKSADTGWVGGNGGKVYYTANAGSTWATQINGTTGLVNAIYFPAPKLGYAAGTLVYKTTNGTGWSTQQASPAFGELRDLSFPDSALGYAVGINGAIWKLRRPGYVPPSPPPPPPEPEEPVAIGSDTGDVWTKLTSGSTASFGGISCPSVSTCYVVGATGTILKTVDTGATWTAQTSGVTATLHDVQFLTPDTGYVSASGYILKTTNGGTNWTISRTGGGAFIALSCRSTTNCIAGSTGTTGTVVTTDGGANWANPTLTTSISQAYEARFTSSTTVWLGGASGILLRNITGGTGTWSANLGPAGAGDIYGMFWQNADTGWISSGSVYRTTNAGTSWGLEPTGASYLNAIYFVNPKVGYAVGDKVYRTRNRGDTWVNQLASPAFGALREIVFPDTALGFAAGTNGAIWKVRRPYVRPVVGIIVPGPSLGEPQSKVRLKREGASVSAEVRGRNFDARGRADERPPLQRGAQPQSTPSTH